jgi:hypothetical protein
MAGDHAPFRATNRLQHRSSTTSVVDAAEELFHGWLAQSAPRTRVREEALVATYARGAVIGALSEYMAEALRHPLPAQVAEKAKHLMLDTLAAMVSGSRLKPGLLAIRYVSAQGGTAEAAVAGECCGDHCTKCGVSQRHARSRGRDR